MVALLPRSGTPARGSTLAGSRLSFVSVDLLPFAQIATQREEQSRK
jgi:hypothetical protein